uniref:BPTI/Kunitz inhibitor domain-containing protein n=1 Tax=Haemonchus contortus TaxID=6289 RepID=A0A7I4Y3R7_HAECO
MNTLQSSTTISVNVLALVLLTKSLESNLSRASVCSLPPSPGYGDCNTDDEERFYFDVYELRCKKFLYMNCLGGNENRFVTEEQCNRFCQSSACAAGEAVAVASSGVPLICDKPSICPQGYKCVYDKLFNRHHCCGFSNNGGYCPVYSVSYISLATGAALPCIPSARSDSCPEGFLCVGKGQSGYCCRPKDICPLGQIAENRLSSANLVKCNLQEVNGDCSVQYECISPYYAPWGFCCSSNATGWCPNNSRPFLSPDNGQPQKCTVGVTVCRVGYSCQSQNNSIIGFCCSDPTDIGYKLLETELEEPYWLQNLSIADEISSAVESSANQPTNVIPTRSAVFDLMTVLSCPDTLSPSYLTDSQLIIECTGTEQSTTTCPAPARCVRAPRDVLHRSVCCSGYDGS